MDNLKDDQNISSKLNLLASLLMEIKQSLGEKMSIKDKVSYLIKRGVVDDDNISYIVGITKNHASKEKALLKKETKEKDGREEMV